MERTPNPDDWFPARVTDVDDSDAPAVYAAKEVAVQGDRTVSEKIGGRVITLLDPAVAVTGGPFAADDIVLVRTAKNAGGLLWELAPLDGSGGAGRSFWVEVTGGTDAGGYSGKRKERASGNTWADATDPDPLTWSGAIWRAPSASATGLPAIPAGQVVRCWPSPLDPAELETDGVGGRQAASGTVGPYLTDVSISLAASAVCNEDGTITVTVTPTVTKTSKSQTVTVTARDCVVTLPGPS